ncbi:MAG: IS1595 family transposase [Massilia sp.]
MPRDSVRRRRTRSLNSPLDRLLPRLHALHPQDKLRVCCFMSEQVNGEQTAALIEQARRPHLSCPECQGTAFNRCGHANGLQRFKCKACGRTFNSLTGTPLARLRLKTRWLAYFGCMRDPGCTVNNAAAKIGVHASTSFRWRHRFLKWTRLDRPARLVGIVEADETFLLESQKGARQLQRPARKQGGVASKRGISAELVNIVVARDRDGKTIDFIAGRGGLKAAALHDYLLPKLAPDVVLVSDANAAYKKFAREARIHHQPVNLRQGKRVIGPYHVQNVNAYHSRFKGWLQHFRGVATAYLDNYLGWRWAIDFGRIDSPERFLRAALGIISI